MFNVMPTAKALASKMKAAINASLASSSSGQTKLTMKATPARLATRTVTNALTVKAALLVRRPFLLMAQIPMPGHAQLVKKNAKKTSAWILLAARNVKKNFS